MLIILEYYHFTLWCYISSESLNLIDSFYDMVKLKKNVNKQQNLQNKLLPEPMLTQFYDSIFDITKPKWINNSMVVHDLISQEPGQMPFNFQV